MHQSARFQVRRVPGRYPAQMNPALELERIEGPMLATGRWRIAHPFRIGRAEGNEIELSEPSISRRHVSIESDSEGWVLRDCGSLLGSRLNELPIAAGTAVALRAGDVIGIGPWRFRVNAVVASAAEEDNPESPAHISLVRAAGSLAEQRLELLLRYAGEVAAAPDAQILAEIVAEHALLGSGYSRAAVIWRDGEHYRVRCRRPAPLAGTAPWKFNASLLKSASNGEIARLDSEVPSGGGAVPAAGKLRRALCAPLMLDGYAQAFLYLDADRPAMRRNADAPSFCHALARLGALALANLHRLDSERERASLSADLERARDVQNRLLPAPVGRFGALDYALRLHPGRVVAGDIVDVFALAEGRIAAVLGDVSGAGFGAGLVMASVQSFLRAGFAHDDDPARVIRQLNAHLCSQSSAGRFVTLWLGVFEADGSRCRFVDAGHGHAVRMRAGVVDSLEIAGGIPLGIDAEAPFEAEQLQLDGGDVLLLYSDGVVEQRSRDGDAFGHSGLFAALAAAASPEQAVDASWTALRAHAQGAAPDDDATLLALARAPAPAHA